MGARFGGSLDLIGAHIESPEGRRSTEDATIEGSVFLMEDASGRRPLIRGRLDMASTRISGRFLISAMPPSKPIPRSRRQHLRGRSPSAPRSTPPG